MHLIRLSLRNISGNCFRSLVILLSIMGIAGLLVSTTLITKGTQESLNSGLKQLGADILVVPDGAETKMETAILMGIPTNYWMPKYNLQKVAAISGVEAVSPQIYLSSLYGASCCSFSETFLVVYDPETDFTVTPWLQSHLSRELDKGEVIGGSSIFVPNSSQYIELYGYHVTLVGNLKSTGTGLDQTIFMTLETAQAIAMSSISDAVEPLEFSTDRISSILIKVNSGTDEHKVALQIFKNVSGVQAIEGPKLFGTFRQQITELLWGFFTIILIFWVLAMLLVGLIFSLATNERRREMAVLRAIGATRNFILRSVLVEAAILASAGAFLGVLVSTLLLYLLKDFIASTLMIPFLFPSMNSCLLFLGVGVALAVISITLAVLIPAFRFSRQELAVTMRE